ncbi:MAG TPA: hypothetical protein VF097_04975 [Actinomycetota bacterium]
MARPRIRFRSPGVKPGQKIGPLGPFRGRLGLQWVIAPIVLGVILLAAGWLFLRGREPSPPWRPVTDVASLPVGDGRETVPGVFVGRLSDGRVIAVAERAGCPLEPSEDGYADCEGATYGLDGLPKDRGDPLDLVPVRIHDGVLYADPSRRVVRGP